MKLEINEEIIKVLSQFHLPLYQEIPDVGLYLDQTSKIINQYLEAIPECSLTTSMISNYVKHKLVANPIKRQYYRDQIAYLIFIAIIKNTVSLDNIAALFSRQQQISSLDKAYNFFVRQFESQIKNEFAISNTVSQEPLDENKSILANIIKVTVSKIALDEKLKSLREVQ